MADIKAPPGVPASAWRAYGHQQGQQHGGGSHRQAASYGKAVAAAEALGDPVDAVRIQGLNPRAFPEEVQAVLGDLMARIDHLRHELDRATARQGWLEEQVDQDGALPILSRRAFLRELESFLAGERAGDAGVESPVPASGGALALFYLHNFEILHRRFGLGVAEAALVHMAQTLRAGVRASDIIGFAGGTGIAVLLELADEAGAVAKVEALRTVLASSPARHGGVTAPLGVAAAVVMAQPDATAHAWMDAVDACLRPALLASDAP